jgi:hypothetical protein
MWSGGTLQTCTFCKQTGQRFGRAIRFPGYTRRLAVDPNFGNPDADGQSFRVTWRIDRRRLYTHGVMHDMAKRAKAGEERLPFQTGCMSELFRVPYFDFTTLFVVPLAHALLHGVVKDLVTALFQTGCPVRGAVNRKRKSGPEGDEVDMVRCGHTSVIYACM